MLLKVIYLNHSLLIFLKRHMGRVFLCSSMSIKNWDRVFILIFFNYCIACHLFYEPFLVLLHLVFAAEKEPTLAGHRVQELRNLIMVLGLITYLVLDHACMVRKFKKGMTLLLAMFQSVTYWCNFKGGNPEIHQGKYLAICNMENYMINVCES